MSRRNGKADMRPLIWSINNKPEEWVRSGGSMQIKHRNGGVSVEGELCRVTHKVPRSGSVFEGTIIWTDMTFWDRVRLRRAVRRLYIHAYGKTLQEESQKIASAIGHPCEGKMYRGDVVVYEGKLPANEDDIFAYLARKRLTVGE